MSVKKSPVKAKEELRRWLNHTRSARINRDVDELIDSLQPALDEVADAYIAAFVYDYKQANYLYFNRYFPVIFQTRPEVIRDSGFEFLREALHPEDFLSCLNITTKSVSEFLKLKENEKAEMQFRLFFRAKRAKGTYMWVMQTNKIYFFDNGEKMVDVGMVMELFGDQHPMKVMGLIETPTRIIEIFPDVQTELLSSLSYRELEVLQLIRAGLSSKDIADKMKITINTVKVHRKKVLMKLGVKNMIHASRILDQYAPKP